MHQHQPGSGCELLRAPKLLPNSPSNSKAAPGGTWVFFWGLMLSHFLGQLKNGAVRKAMRGDGTQPRPELRSQPGCKPQQRPSVKLLTSVSHFRSEFLHLVSAGSSFTHSFTLPSAAGAASQRSKAFPCGWGERKDIRTPHRSPGSGCEVLLWTKSSQRVSSVVFWVSTCLQCSRATGNTQNAASSTPKSSGITHSER